MRASAFQESIRSMKHISSVLIVASAIIAALFITNQSITTWQSEHDALQNLTAAFHLAKQFDPENKAQLPHGVTVLDNYREPLPVLLLALHIVMDPVLSEVASVEELNAGQTLVRLKRHNLVWAGLLLLGISLTILKFSGTSLVGFGAVIVAIVIVTADYLVKTSIIDRFYTEIQAATILVWCTLAMTLAVVSRRWRWFVAGGLLAGALALTKGSFFYVAVVLPVILAMVCILPPNRWRGAAAAKRFGVMAICFAAVTGPWIVHNYLRFGSPTITQRGGKILMMRVYNNRMTDEEAKGAFYAWAPWIIRDAIGRHLGFSEADLSKGGRLQRLNIHGDEAFVAEDWAAEIAGRPEDALTYYTAARAERVKLLHELRRQGYENPHQETEIRLRQRALKEIFANLGNHIAKTPLFLWRGLWTRSPPSIIQLVLYATVVLGFVGMSIAGLLLRWPVICAFTLPTFGTIMFFALFTQFHPRFPDMLMPVIYAGAVVIGSRIRLKVSFLRETELNAVG